MQGRALPLIIESMSSSMLDALPPRNKGSYLDRCQRVNLITNLFKVTIKENLKVFIFAIKSDPEIPRENGKKLRSLIAANRLSIQRTLGPFVISGRTIFGTKSHTSGKEEFRLDLEYESVKYKLFLRNVKEICLANINAPEKEVSGVAFTFLNNMIRNFFHQMNYTEIGRSKKYFDPSSRKRLDGADVTAYKGYSTSFSLLENGLFLKVDPTVKIIQSQSALDLINKIYKRNSSLSKTQKRLLIQEELIGKSVMANYGRNLCYRIQSIAFDITIESYQFTHQNKVMSILDYYAHTYDINIKVKNQPLIRAQSTRHKSNSENANEVILVPQLVLMNGLPDDFDQRKRREVSQLTIVDPGKKLDEIEDLFAQINKADGDYNPQLIGQKLGIKFETTPTMISAKQLKFPQLQLGGKDRVEQHKTTNFMLFNKNLFSREVTLKMYIILPNDFDFSPIKSLFESTSANLGLQYQLTTNFVNFKDNKAVLKTIETALKNECESKHSNMFWFIIPPSFKTQYKQVKRMTLKNGLEINSQVTISTNLQKKGFQSIFTKILLQMAAKLGNKLWVPKISQRIASSGTLLIGIQTTKDSEFKGKNVISYCSNNTKDFSSFYSNYIYDSSSNIKTYMKQIVFQCINDYMQKTQTAPTELIVIKNGTVKLDLGSVIETEVQEIKDILRSVSKSSETVKLTYIILDKNASQKFFIEKGKDISNPISGTLINAQAVGKGFQFYLIAQQCNRGTVKPTYYKVAYTDSQMDEGIIEELIYSQCFNYMNWTGSIKVPGALQYAKKLGAFIGQYINRESNMENLQRNLYYI